jgi:hypothetical protein
MQVSIDNEVLYLPMEALRLALHFHALTCIACGRSKEEALAALRDGLKDVLVPGTDWDTAEALQTAASSIDAHISQLRSKKVAYQLDWAHGHLRGVSRIPDIMKDAMAGQVRRSPAVNLV